MTVAVETALRALAMRVDKEIARASSAPSTTQVGGVIKVAVATEEFLRVLATARCDELGIAPNAWVARQGDGRTRSVERAGLQILLGGLSSLLAGPRESPTRCSRLVAQLDAERSAFERIRRLRNPVAHTAAAIDATTLRADFLALREAIAPLVEAIGSAAPSTRPRRGR